MSQTIGDTLTGGIQDISAILPLLGTEQCENHVGSALDGGYLYAAAAPLSIFGSLGVVKAGISILIASISLPQFHISFSRTPITFSQDRWMGAKTLQNAGYKLPGTVAPLIAMDGTRYDAETRLLQILEEKHIDDPEKLSIEWKSRQWNIVLLLSTTAIAVVSGLPYFALLGSTSWRPSTHTPWIFPVLRTVGSCVASICSQFLIQSRVISIMKHRILFMAIHRRLIDNLSKDNAPDVESRLLGSMKWNENLPSEECLWNMERLFSDRSIASDQHPCEAQAPNLSVVMENTPSMEEGFKSQFPIIRALCNEHFPSPLIDTIFTLISWTFLLVSLPTAVAGYIGCFTLVSTSKGNGPLIWLGLEAALSIIRILIWAWNPSFDEETLITVKLKLAEHRPLITTEKNVLETSIYTKPFPLFSQRRFLERITAFTGPLDEFRHSQDVALYFTFSACIDKKEDIGINDENKSVYGSLMMTFSDHNKQIAATLSQIGNVLRWYSASVTYNTFSGEMEAVLHSEIRKDDPWPTKEPALFGALMQYYESIVCSFDRTDGFQSPPIAHLPWKWNLLPKQMQSNNSAPSRILQHLTDHDILYLNRGYEHSMKSNLINIWSRWISEDMKHLLIDAHNDCYYALSDPLSEKAKWELTELDCSAAWEWTRRELALLISSIAVEGSLKRRMEDCIATIYSERKDDKLREWMRSEFQIGKRVRLENERREARERMEVAMKNAGDRAERKGRSWKVHGNLKKFIPKWQDGQSFIDEQWSSAIDGKYLAQRGILKLDNLINQNVPWSSRADDQPRLHFIHSVRQRFLFWDSQRKNERHQMDSTIRAIQNMEDHKSRFHLSRVYRYPDPDREATRRFAMLKHSESKGKVCSAIVYDVRDCDQNIVYEVINKPTTRSVINVRPEFVASIPVNQHLLFLGCSGKGEEPLFVQQNRDRWWDQQKSNSSIFYYTPDGLNSAACYTYTTAPIAHLYIYLSSRSRVRLRLLHRADSGVSAIIQEDSNEILRIPGKISESLQLQDLEPYEFMPGRHKLQIIPHRDSKDNRGHYCLRDILAEFLDPSVKP